MLRTYKATLKGNCLEWSGDAPEHLPPEKEVHVYVTILDESTASQGQRMAAALEQLASIHALAEIADPAVWEREVRQDRVLLGQS
jgi:hypothetical protein